MFLLFSEVFKARDKKGKIVVAMKKVLMENEKEGVSLFLNMAYICFSFPHKKIYRPIMIGI